MEEKSTIFLAQLKHSIKNGPRRASQERHSCLRPKTSTRNLIAQRNPKPVSESSSKILWVAKRQLSCLKATKTPFAGRRPSIWILKRAYRSTSCSVDLQEPEKPPRRGRWAPCSTT